MNGRKRHKLLLVDDTPENLQLLVGAFRQEYILVAARNGEKALLLAEKSPQPDLILLDIMMPGMDGYEVCRKLKANPVTQQIPVVFVTAKDDVKDEFQGFAVGGIDYITKPFSVPIVHARIKTHLALLEAYSDIARQNELLRFERDLVESIILKMRETPELSEKHMRSLVTPLEKTTGDLLFAAKRPDGVVHILLGDFTGHGLPAALGGPMVRDIFYAMTAKGFAYLDILREINKKLYAKLPINIYLAACFLTWRMAERSLSVWNAGVPDVLMFRDSSLLGKVASQHPPLGIVKQIKDKKPTPTFKMKTKDRVFVYSDGIVETCNHNKKMFGEERLVETLSTILEEQLPLTVLQERLDVFRDGKEATDDITMVELICK